MIEHTPESRHPQHRRVLWTRKAGVPAGPLRMRCDFHCSIDQPQPTAPMSQLGRVLYTAHRRAAPSTPTRGPAPTTSASVRWPASSRPARSARPGTGHALFDYVDGQVANEAGVGSRLLKPAGAAECLADGSGERHRGEAAGRAAAQPRHSQPVAYRRHPQPRPQPDGPLVG